MQAIIEIQNLKCGGCSNTIKNKLNEIDDIENVTIDVENSIVYFDYSFSETLEIAKNKLALIGYPANGITNSVFTKAKSYVSCAVGKLSKDQNMSHKE